MTREEAIAVLDMVEAHGSLVVEAKDMAIKALEQEGYYKCLAQSYEKTIVKLTEAVAEQQPSEDCVSRQAVLEIVNDWWGITSTSGEPTLCDCIRELPSVAPTRKKGKWICVHHIENKITYDSWKCSECQHDFNSEEESMVDFDEYKFCPNCGAEMEDEE